MVQTSPKHQENPSENLIYRPLLQIITNRPPCSQHSPPVALQTGRWHYLQLRHNASVVNDRPALSWNIWKLWHFGAGYRYNHYNQYILFDWMSLHSHITPKQDIKIQSLCWHWLLFDQDQTQKKGHYSNSVSADLSVSKMICNVPRLTQFNIYSIIYTSNSILINLR